MSEINSIAQGTYTLGQTSATTYQAGNGIQINEPETGIVEIEALQPKCLEYITNITAGANTGFGNYVCCYLSAYVPEGYKFGSWIGCSTQGWGGSCYPEFPLESACNCWNPSRADKTTTGAKVRATYIVFPDNGGNA